ncbi:PREDICTED: cysteine proteinase inhibitor 5-like [Ipomoea nil]|uniref:cysteine proteinase inhibitor 5-like n=1 Tax=Ipomoea nil TaxID=35883 RepID=UPI0009018271|nr:PREDICTED: cysteine proteinase inhibitor 5-like [Ipomoea nil]
MAMNSRSVSLTLFSLVVVTAVFSAAHGARKELVPGGWSPIKDLKDPVVVEIANFAINTHNKEAKSNLVFKSVIGGESQIIEGLNYKLDIEVEEGNCLNKYEALVWDKPSEKLLTSFKKL